MHRGLFSSALLLLTGAAGCQEPPSFQARWTLVDRENIERSPTAPLVCTSLGINTVRVRVLDELGNVADESFHACFAEGFEDPDATVAGPSLGAGRYSIEVRGVQRDLEPWAVSVPEAAPLTSCNLDEVACDPRDIACDCGEFEARDEHTETLVDFVLGAPDECIDGIDNDRDGLLDANDPSCDVGVTPGRENNPVSKVQFRVALSLFGGNDAVSCLLAGVSDVRARVCPRVAGAAPAACIDASDAAVFACRIGEPSFFEQNLPEGDYTLEVVARDAKDVVLTAPALFPITVSQGSGVVPIDVDFSAASFDPPIDKPARFTLVFPEGGIGTDTHACPTYPIADVALEVFDAHGGALDTPVTLEDGVALDGTPIACPTATLETETLLWGGYALRVVARAADGTVCFTTDGTGPDGADAPLLLAPSVIELVVPRVLDAAGAPPASCVD